MDAPKTSSLLPTDVVQLAALVGEIEHVYGAISPQMKAFYQALKEQEGAAAARSLLIRAGHLFDLDRGVDAGADVAEVMRPVPMDAREGAPYWAAFFGFLDKTKDAGPGAAKAGSSGIEVRLATGHVSDRVADFDDDERYADRGGEVQLVQVEMTGKVALPRPDAIALAGAVLEATSQSFHALRYGQLRPGQARDLLDAVRDAELKLADLREHLFEDLLDGVGLFADPVDPFEGETA
jgi:hypothetical protein